MKILTAAAFAALLTTTALADDVMNFTVNGVTPDGAAYSGTVVVEELPKTGVGEGDRFRVTWNTGGEPVVGTGVVQGSDRKTLAVGYGNAGVSIMTESNGSLSGLWAIPGIDGTGTEVWTPVADGGATAAPAAPAPAGAITYEGAVECAAATSFMVGTLRMAPGSDAAKIDAYDKANSAWIMKLGDIGADKTMDQRISDIQAKQAVYAADANGVAVATPIADACVASAPPME